MPYVPEFTFMEGSPGLSPDDVAHVFIPGRGRNADATGISPESEDRVVVGAEFYASRRANPTTQRSLGNFVCAGYKSPADSNGEPWRHPVDHYNGPTFTGKPEAFGMNDVLDQINPSLLEDFGYGVPVGRRRLEPFSIDTVTNFAQAEALRLFGDNEDPVIIAAQAGHLERILKHVAPKILRRPYLGLVVPVAPGSEDTDSWSARAFSRVVTIGVDARRQSADYVLHRTTRQVGAVWGMKLQAQRLIPR